MSDARILLLMMTVALWCLNGELANSPCMQRPGLFACDNGYCKDKHSRCNGKNDCGDYSDEFNCVDNEVDQCGQDQFMCEKGGFDYDNYFYYYEDRSPCIDAILRCDGYVDCTDGTDELCHALNPKDKTTHTTQTVTIERAASVPKSETTPESTRVSGESSSRETDMTDSTPSKTLETTNTVTDITTDLTSQTITTEKTASLTKFETASDTDTSHKVTTERATSVTKSTTAETSQVSGESSPKYTDKLDSAASKTFETTNTVTDKITDRTSQTITTERAASLAKSETTEVSGEFNPREKEMTDSSLSKTLETTNTITDETTDTSLTLTTERAATVTKSETAPETTRVSVESSPRETDMTASTPSKILETTNTVTDKITVTSHTITTERAATVSKPETTQAYGESSRRDTGMTNSTPSKILETTHTITDNTTDTSQAVTNTESETSPETIIGTTKTDSSATEGTIRSTRSANSKFIANTQLTSTTVTHISNKEKEVSSPRSSPHTTKAPTEKEMKPTQAVSKDRAMRIGRCGPGYKMSLVHQYGPIQQPSGKLNYADFVVECYEVHVDGPTRIGPVKSSPTLGPDRSLMNSDGDVNSGSMSNLQTLKLKTIKYIRQKGNRRRKAKVKESDDGPIIAACFSVAVAVFGAILFGGKSHRYKRKRQGSVATINQ